MGCTAGIVLLEVSLVLHLLLLFYFTIISWEHWVQGKNNAELQMKEKKRLEKLEAENPSKKKEESKDVND